MGAFSPLYGGGSGSGGSGAPTDATYITQTANGSLSAEQALSALATGILKNTTATGVLSIAAAGTDYVAPGGALGTPSSGTLTNCTGLPVGGISGFAAGVATFLATPSSANLAAALTDETGSGAAVFANTPTLVSPLLGTPTSGTLTNCTGLPAAGVVGTAAILGANTFTGAQLLTVNGAVSAPGLTANGTWYSGGSATTTKPYVLIEPSGTTSTAWSTNGTGLGVNAASGTGNVFDFQSSGVTRLKQLVSDGTLTVTGNGAGDRIDIVPGSHIVGYDNSASRFYVGPNGVTLASNMYFDISDSTNIDSGGSGDVALTRRAAATWNLGGFDAASPVNQKLSTQGSRAGTDSNIGGANLTIQSGLGTGTGTISTLSLNSPVAVGSGTGAQTSTTGLTIKAGTAVLSSYIVANLPAAGTAGAGATAFVTDASTTLVLGLGGSVTGGGANKVPVYSDGTNWIYG